MSTKRSSFGDPPATAALITTRIVGWEIYDDHAASGLEDITVN